MQDILNFKELDALAQTYGDSFFVLDGQRFEDNYRALHKSFSKYYEKVHIGYSYKTNYTPQLCKIVDDLGGYAEVVSEMEYAHAKALGVDDKQIIFNGPVKAKWAFESAAVNGAMINLDSLRDVELMAEVAQINPDKILNVLIRSNFSIGEQISRFGMDVDGAEFQHALDVIKSRHNIELKGLHCHFPDRDLESFKRRAEGVLEVVRRIFIDAPPEIINIGGGYFSNMPASLRDKFNTPPATFEDYGRVIGRTFSEAFHGNVKPKLFLEPGTALVADTQAFYTKVISVKEIRGKCFATVAGSGFDISPTARSRNLPVNTILATPRAEHIPTDIVGFTCIEGDILTEDLKTNLRAGDFLRYSNVGSYSVVMRPPFILPSNPILYKKGTDSLTLIKRRQTNEAVFRDFIY